MSLIAAVKLAPLFIKNNKLYAHRTCIKPDEVHP
jgi:hypothetical protein